MARIKLIDRADMNAEQGRVYDAAKAANGPVGGPYYAYIRLPKLFEASQNLRGTLAAGPLSRREQQMIHLAVARHWGAKYPWFAQVRASLGGRHRSGGDRRDQCAQRAKHRGRARARLFYAWRANCSPTRG